MNPLTQALAVNRDAIARALPIAEQSLAECKEHCAQLESEIRNAKLVLAVDPGSADSLAGRQPLHEAMIQILGDHPEGLPAPEIARIVEERDLYRRRDGGVAGLGQVHARAHNYPRLFVRDGGRIRLRQESDPPARA